MAPCTAAGLICCYVGLDVTTCPPSTILCDGELRLICIDLMCCLAQGKEQMPVGMVKEDGKICKVSLPIISASAFNPDMSNLIKLDGNLLCIKAAGQLPFGGPTPGPICSCKPPPRHTHQPLTPTHPSHARPPVTMQTARPTMVASDMFASRRSSAPCLLFPAACSVRRSVRARRRQARVRLLHLAVHGRRVQVRRRQGCTRHRDYGALSIPGASRKESCKNRSQVNQTAVGSVESPPPSYIRTRMAAGHASCLLSL
jgi:hypothetical protein